MFPTICRCCGAVIDDRALDNVNLCSECRAGQSEDGTRETGSTPIDSFPLTSPSIHGLIQTEQETGDVPAESLSVQEGATANDSGTDVREEKSDYSSRPSGRNLPRRRSHTHTAFY